MTTLDAVTAVKWQWRADDKWTDFDAKTNLMLEDEYNKGTKKIKVDDERFVDVSLTHAIIKKNFYCIDCEDKTCIGLQRRYDDEMRRRAVRRDAQPFFKGKTFVLCIANADKSNLAERVITTHKGAVKVAPTKRTSYVISDADPDIDKFEEEFKFCIDNDITVLSDEFLLDCIKTGDLLEDEDIEAFIVDVKKKQEASKKRKEPEPADEEEMKEEEEEEKVEEPPKKKQKLSDSGSTGANTNAAALKPPSASIKANRKWMGVCSYASQHQHFPFTITILTINGNNINGTIDWPTLKNAKTKIKGTVSGDDLQWTEYEAIRGEDEVELPVDYKAKLDGDDISGSVNESDPEFAGTFKASLVVEDEDEEAANSKLFNANSVYKGACVTEFPFEMKITKRTGNSIEGTMNWTTMKCTTKFKGTIDGENIKFEEYEVANVAADGDEPEVPMQYQGQLAGGEDSVDLKGTYGDPKKPIGKFTLFFE